MCWLSIGIDLKRFENFKDAEFRSLEISSSTDISLTYALQDAARAFDWITITLHFSGISDARLLDESKMSLIDMSNGISIINHENKLAFGIGECYNVSSIKSSTCYIISDNLKYQEGTF